MPILLCSAEGRNLFFISLSLRLFLLGKEGSRFLSPHCILETDLNGDISTLEYVFG